MTFVVKRRITRLSRAEVLMVVTWMQTFKFLEDVFVKMKIHNEGEFSYLFPFFNTLKRRPTENMNLYYQTTN